MGPQHARAQHRRQRQRHESGHDDRDRYRDREFAEHAADDAAHQQHRNEHRDQREGDRDDGKADLARALQRRLERPHAVLDVADDVFQHDDGVVDHEADRERQRQQRHVVDGIVERVHHRAGAEQRDRNRQRRNEGGRGRAQEQEDHQDDQPDRDQQGLLDVGHRLTDRDRAVHHHLHRDRGRNLRPQRRQFRQHRIDHRHGVGVRLLLDREHDRPLAVQPGRDLVVLDAFVDFRDLVELDRRAVAPGHHDLAVVGRLVHLAGGLQGDVLLRPVQGADRRRRIGARHRGPDVVERQPARGGRFRIGLDADGEFLGAVDQHLRHAGNLRQRLPDGDVAILVDRRQRQRRRAERDEQHREVGRVHFSETRRDRHFDRQPPLRDGQRGLHVERGGVDVAVEIELDGDDAGALRGARRHRGNAGDGRELAFDDAGDRGRHGVRAGARQGRGDGNGREIDPRQRRDRQQAEAENAERDDRRRDQRRHDRPADTEFGERHRLRSGLFGPRPRPAFHPTAAIARRRRRFRRRRALP